MFFRPDFEPFSSFFAMRSTSRCAASSSCLIVFASPDSAGGGLGNAQSVSHGACCNRHFLAKLSFRHLILKCLLPRTNTFQSPQGIGSCPSSNNLMRDILTLFDEGSTAGDTFFFFSLIFFLVLIFAVDWLWVCTFLEDFRGTLDTVLLAVAAPVCCSSSCCCCLLLLAAQPRICMLYFCCLLFVVVLLLLLYTTLLLLLLYSSMDAPTIR